MSNNPWSRYQPPGPEKTTMIREYKDKPGKWVPVTPNHRPHVDAEGKPVEYTERPFGPRDAVEFSRLARQAQKPSPVRRLLLERVVRSLG